MTDIFIRETGGRFGDADTERSPCEDADGN